MHINRNKLNYKVFNSLISALDLKVSFQLCAQNVNFLIWIDFSTFVIMIIVKNG